MKHTLLLLSVLFITGCKKPQTGGSLFPKAPSAHAATDLEAIVSSGELIVGTLSGPDSYYDLNGEPMGEQYALAENFANGHGLSVRIEVAHTEEELITKLLERDIDVAAYMLPDTLIQAHKLMPAGVSDSSNNTTWAVHSDTKELAQALKKWYTPGLEKKLAAEERKRIIAQREIKRTMRPAYISRARGIISVYDDLFRQGAQIAGLDWRLLAAMSYTESGFDPNALSGAGARGLMQLMPTTARQLGVTDPYSPEQNVEAGARLLRQLLQTFSDIRDNHERIKFALAAYNGGIGHVRDAMALARKHNRNTQRWDEVREFILLLSRPEYYRDPIVKYGYMIGKETYDYVSLVAARYTAYGGRDMSTGNTTYAPPAVDMESEYMQRQNNKYTHGTTILPPDDPAFQHKNE